MPPASAAAAVLPAAFGCTPNIVLLGAAARLPAAAVEAAGAAGLLNWKAGAGAGAAAAAPPAAAAGKPNVVAAGASVGAGGAPNAPPAAKLKAGAGAAAAPKKLAPAAGAAAAPKKLAAGLAAVGDFSGAREREKPKHGGG